LEKSLILIFSEIIFLQCVYLKYDFSKFIFPKGEDLKNLTEDETYFFPFNALFLCSSVCLMPILNVEDADQHFTEMTNEIKHLK
jgi:hypothetical protein